MKDFNKYFQKNKRIFLENISYETLGTGEKLSSRRLGCRDTVISQLLLPAGIKITFNRRLNFEPESLYTLSVSFAVMLSFINDVWNEVNWKEINIVEEFTKNNPAIFAEMNARTTLIVGQITSAAGGMPLITSVPVIPRCSKGEEPVESE